MKFYSIIVTDLESNYENTLCCINGDKRNRKGGYITQNKEKATSLVKQMSELFPHAKYTLIESTE